MCPNQPDPRLEAFLDRLEEPLASELPGLRLEWREEARQHILAIAEAYEELGHTPEQAIQLAMRRFGAPQRIGRGVRKAIRRPPLISRDTEISMAVLAVNVLVGVGVLNLAATAPYYDPILPLAMLLYGCVAAGGLLGWFCGSRGHRVASIGLYAGLLTAAGTLTGSFPTLASAVMGITLVGVVTGVLGVACWAGTWSRRSFGSLWPSRSGNDLAIRG